MPRKKIVEAEEMEQTAELGMAGPPEEGTDTGRTAVHCRRNGGGVTRLKYEYQIGEASKITGISREYPQRETI